MTDPSPARERDRAPYSLPGGGRKEDLRPSRAAPPPKPSSPKRSYDITDKAQLDQMFAAYSLPGGGRKEDLRPSRAAPPPKPSPPERSYDIADKSQLDRMLTDLKADVERAEREHGPGPYEYRFD